MFKSEELYAALKEKDSFEYYDKYDARIEDAEPVVKKPKRKKKKKKNKSTDYFLLDMLDDD